MNAKESKQMVIQAQNYLDEINKEDHAKEEIKAIRPPELWNYPKLIKEKH